ncbi:beta-galactosidase [Marinovum sp. 2_MG-2023]|uniref:beta-galactosidase n=1 Tax=unclassified Marinovum TaxID=2647166 RepID=UPI0026E46F98|nr:MULTISPECIES: beta-galactosidase [unclassified Marinovum]MDO6732380.1 beta-galactosidase [Marinovum sp. 2_MG-2023]MDO6781697.1 beta-galactosidase [Marinovum sp. 1_MG-2023]
MTAKTPQIPFGAVYFRKSNPPREDWSRDYGIASQDGLNTFRHWFMWSAIERKPGVFDWDDCDRQLDLAAENNMATVIAEFTMAAPDWLQRKYAQHRQVSIDGKYMASTLSPSVAVGGFGQGLGGAGALTLNAPEVHEAVMEFLTTLATRYKDHPGLYGYDVNNEVNYQPDFDFSDATAAAFRVWLQEKYGSLDALAEVWHRYSYAEWDDIMPPRQVQPYAECYDWLRFRRDNFYGHVEDKIATIRAVDPHAKIISHGIAGAVTALGRHGCDDWRAASQVDIYGYTWIAARKGNQAWRNFFAGDLIRGASRGKPFWHAERQGGPLWMQPQVMGRDKDDARVAEPSDIRLWSLASFAAGARGMMNLRYRPLLDGPLFGAFGSYGMDGSRTERSDMAASIAQWTNAPEQADAMAAKPMRGEVGLLFADETQMFDSLLSAEGQFKTFQEAMWGAYRGFMDAGLQPDWVHPDDMDGYDVIYAPYPVMWPRAVAERIRDWVAAGGTLISEACPAYFGDHGRVGVHQPNFGLDQMFGAREVEVEFMPDIADHAHFELNGTRMTCGGFRQAYDAPEAEVLARFPDGKAAIVANTHGAGRTLLVGSHLSAADFQARETGGSGAPGWWDFVCDWAGVTANVTCTNSAVITRLHCSDNARYVWCINPTNRPQTCRISIDGAPVEGRPLWLDGTDRGDGTFDLTDRGALVVSVPVS